MPRKLISGVARLTCTNDTFISLDILYPAFLPNGVPNWHKASFSPLHVIITIALWDRLWWESMTSPWAPNELTWQSRNPDFSGFYTTEQQFHSPPHCNPLLASVAFPLCRFHPRMIFSGGVGKNCRSRGDYRENWHPVDALLDSNQSVEFNFSCLFHTTKTHV